MTNEEFVRQISESEKSLYRVAKSILKNDEDCADAIQNAVLKAFRNIGTLKQEKYFRTWLTRILINECYQIMRGKRSRFPVRSIWKNGWILRKIQRCLQH